MLDPQFVRNNINLIKKTTQERNMKAEVVDEWLTVDSQRKELLVVIEDLRHTRKNQQKPVSDADREAIRTLKTDLASKEEQLKTIEEQWTDLLQQIPNVHPDGTPIGKTDEENQVAFRSEKVTEFDFEPKDHLDVALAKDWLDFDRGAKVAGSQFYYIKGDLVLLEMALTQFLFDLAISHGFVPLHTPDMARSRFYLGTGYNPRGNEAQTYEIADEDLGLIATAEVTTAGYHADEVLTVADLPKKYISLSHCFRKEAGAYGKYSRGLYRVHQFTKLEMFIYSRPEDSEQHHQEMLQVEREVMEKLGIPYQVLNICTGDLGAMAAKKYDVEAWMPGRKGFGEVTSTSNCTDYQSRNLNIRFRDADGSMKYAHLLNGTAGALSRLLIAVIENYQQADGSVTIPEALQPYMVGGKKVI